MRKISWIVIHCSATPPETKVDSILNYWRNNLGWKYPGYHRLIEPCGQVKALLDFENVSNGVKGYNHEIINISYIGGVDRAGKPQDTRTLEQKAMILNCIQEALHWTALHQSEVPTIIGHHDLNPHKACPSFDAKTEYACVSVS